MMPANSGAIWLLTFAFAYTAPLAAQDNPTSEGGGSSPFPAPERTDLQFVVDSGPGLDTGCTFASGGPLVFEIEIDRYFGDVDQLVANGLLPEFVRLQMPAFDVDFDANISGIEPERDEVYVNDNLVDERYLTGTDGTWKLNEFSIPIAWLNFPPSEPASGQAVTPEPNVIRIEIDVANGGTDNWCTAIDWASLRFDFAPRPVLFAHGILSCSESWSQSGLNWASNLDGLGIPHSGSGDRDPLDLGLLGSFICLDPTALASIQSNASKIQQRVTELRNRWGVDQVNLICHSKGGLDARLVAAQSDDIGCLIQLGTPNLGSPLADLVQTGLVLGCRATPNPLVCRIALAGVNFLAAPAGRQLTTDYMSAFSATTPRNPKTQYVSIATEYVTPPGCFFTCLIDRFLLLVVGEGDTVVPTWSQHGLSGATRVGPLGPASNSEFKHTGQTSSPSVYAAARPYIQACGSTGSSSAPSGQQLPLPIPFITRAGVSPAGASDVLSFPVDGGAACSFLLLYPDGEAEFTITSPSGVVYDASTPQGTDGVHSAATTELTGLGFQFLVEDPEVGVWDAAVLTVTPPSGETELPWLAGWIGSESDLTLDARVLEIAPTLGGSATIEATLLRDGLPETAVLEALVQGSDGVVTTVILLDDGTAPDATASDGIYTGVFDPITLTGTHNVAVVANSVAAAPAPFERQTLATFAVGSSSSSLDGTFMDRGVDIDSDGYFDELALDIGVQIGGAADFAVYGELIDSAGHVLVARVESPLAPGSGVMTLRFDGRTLYDNGVNGPYDLRIVRLLEDDEFDIVTIDGLTNAFSTAAYSFEVFEHDLIALTGQGTDMGVDVGGDPRFERLDVELELAVEVAGTYAWSARLVDSEGDEIGFANGQGSLPGSTQSILLSFSGDVIGANGVDGPYFVRDLLVNGSGGALVANEVVYVSAPYDVSMFSGFQGWSSSCSGTTNSTGFSAELALQGTVSVSANDVVLAARRLPPHAFALSVYGSTAANLPLGSGVLCVSPFAPGLIRLDPIMQANSGGEVEYNLDLTGLPTFAQIQAGETWYFQMIYRDRESSAAVINTTNAIEVTFTP